MQNKVVNYWLVLIISICFGFLGLDRFFVGDIRSGLLKFFTLGFCGIWWIIDIFLFALKKIPNVTFVTSSKSKKVGIILIAIISLFYISIFNIDTNKTSSTVNSNLENTSISSQKIEKDPTAKPTKIKSSLVYEITKFNTVKKDKYLANVEVEKKLSDNKFKEISKEIQSENSGFKNYIFTFFLGDSKTESNKYVELTSIDKDFELEYFDIISVETSKITKNTTIKPSDTITATLTTEKLIPTPTATPVLTNTEAKGEIVYITETGKKYHSAGCQYLWNSKIEITLSEAESRGYTACSRCR